MPRHLLILIFLLISQFAQADITTGHQWLEQQQGVDGRVSTEQEITGVG